MRRDQLAVVAVAVSSLLIVSPLGAQKGKPRLGEVLYSGFGVDDAFNESSGHHVSAGTFGDADVAAAFTVPTDRTYALTSIELALGLFQGANELDVWVVGSQLGTDAGGNVRPEPNTDDVLEYFRVHDTVPPGGILLLESITRPLLLAGNQYWIVLSAPIDGTFIMFYSAAPELEGGPGRWIADSENGGTWNVNFSSPGRAFRIVARKVGGKNK